MTTSYATIAFDDWPADAEVATGFVWGREYGYAQGISDIIRAIMEKLPESQLKTLPS